VKSEQKSGGLSHEGVKIEINSAGARVSSKAPGPAPNAAANTEALT